MGFLQAVRAAPEMPTIAGTRAEFQPATPRSLPTPGELHAREGKKKRMNLAGGQRFILVC